MSEPYIVVQDLAKRFRIAERDPGLWGALKGDRQPSLSERGGAAWGELRDRPQASWWATSARTAPANPPPSRSSPAFWCPSGGQCSVAGLTPWKSRVEHVARIGVVFGQRTQLWWDLPVIESFELLRDIYRVPEARYVQGAG